MSAVIIAWIVIAIWMTLIVAGVALGSQIALWRRERRERGLRMIKQLLNGLFKRVVS